MKRYGQIVKVKPEKECYYRELHANPWPEVLKVIRECNIRNYSIYIRDGWAFSYYEYYGTDYEADMKKMAEDVVTQEWWKECIPCLQPIETASKDACWSQMDEVFYYEGREKKDE